MRAHIMSVLAAAAVMAAATTARADEWFVAPGGAGDGSAGNPFGAIQDGLDAGQPGDVITVAAGTYEEELTTRRPGSPGNPITLRAAAGETVVVTAAATVLSVEHADIAVERLAIDAQYAAADAIIVEDAADRFVLRQVEVRRAEKDCLDIRSPDDVLIDRALIHHCLNAAGGRTDAHGIVAGAAQRLTVRDTEIHTFSGDAIQLDPDRGTPAWTDLLIEGCTFWLEPLPGPENGFPAGAVPGENAFDSKTPDAGERSRVTIRTTTAYGFRAGLIPNMAPFNLKENIDALVDRVVVRDSEHAFRVRAPATIRIQNALVTDVDHGVRYENDIQGVRVYNVTFGLDVAQPFQEASSGASVLDVRNALFLAGEVPDEAAAAASNLAVDESAFADAAGGDYHLPAGSPAIDSGDAIDGVATDLDGNARPQADRFDVGAYERCETECAPAPDAGPGAPGGDLEDSDGCNTGRGSAGSALGLALALAFAARRRRRRG